MEEVLVIELPDLPPVGSPKSAERIRPVSKISYPFLDEIDDLNFSSLHILDRWRLPAHRSGMLILRSNRLNDDPLFHIISLRPTAALPPVPSHTRLTSEEFPRDSEFSDSVAVFDDVGLYFCILQPTYLVTSILSLLAFTASLITVG
ncbi:hypothetical protein DL93DRAFT_2091755 [Clavulina sp. PMI_390]|nr:hypothetical protein DL93DRAFT_2091755 [Clavulina sp. PMI_390]